MLSLILRHKLLLVKIFWLAYALWVGILLISVIFPKGDAYWVQLGRVSGNASVVFFSLAMLPGILRRFRISAGPVQQLRLILMAFRRQLGISVFVTALSHQLWVKTIPALTFGASLLPNVLFEVFGTISLMLLLPLVLTSNDFSVKKLGKKWQVLHRLVYIVAWTVFFHVALNKDISLIAGLILTVAVLELTSWLYFWFSQPKPVQPPVKT